MAVTRSVRSWAWSAMRPLIHRASSAYVAGTDLRSALRVSGEMREHGVACTLCYWDGPGDTPESTAGHYLDIVAALSREKFDGYLSVKAPALKYSRTLFGQVLDEARRQGVRVHFDALRPETAAPTFSLIRDLRPRDGEMGCTLPGRWRRSIADVDRVIELGLSVRVVKGQWADSEDTQRDPRAGFLEVIDRLAGTTKGVSVATHDPALAREALLRLRAGSTSCELELLFGLPTRRSLPVAMDLAAPVRYYVPYGSAWLPYALGQLKKNPRIAWWAIHDVLFPAPGPSALPSLRVSGR
jgi:proline dehydrogenase